MRASYSGQRHSPLKQITVENAGSLVPKWTYHVPKANGLRTNPIVYDGIMYVTNSNEVRALDARTGRLVWEYKDTRSKEGSRESRRRNSGRSGVLRHRRRSPGFARPPERVAVVAETVWAHRRRRLRVAGAACCQRQSDRRRRRRRHRDARICRAFRRKLARSCGASTPCRQKGEPGSETWGEFVEWGGAGTWLSGTYDPELNLVYWTTGNPWPDFYAGDRKGDNLYSCSVIALDLDTGKLKWHFQFTPGDTHDWDAQAWPVLVDMPYAGQPRKLLLHANRNGFLYVLDRVTGEYLTASKLIDKLDWAKGIDKKGRPILIPGKDPTPVGNRVCPGVRGATNWMSPIVQSGNETLLCRHARAVRHVRQLREEARSRRRTSRAAEPVRSRSISASSFVRAFDPATGKRVWEYPMTGPAESWAGTVSTAGGVVFFGDDDGHLVAVDARNGRHLWHYQMGEGLTASPITYAVDGKQYVAIASATAIFSFGLFEPVKP